MSPAPALANDQIHSVPLALLDESPTNTRRTWGNLEELAESIRAVGILQPLVARRVADRYELVFGHRRFRAGKKAKLDLFPVIVRVMGDAQAQEAQVVENLQRTDLHPLEEAEGFEQLHKLGWAAEEMAAKIGKSRTYVFGRMQLLKLVPEGRNAFYEGKLSASVALYLSRVPSTLQVKALEDLAKEAVEQARFGNDVEWMHDKATRKSVPKPGTVPPISARAAADLLQDRYMLQLSQAPFDRADAELVPGAGPCSSCPYRTGNQKELFADVDSPDVCTSPDCFASKKLAAAARVAAKLEKKGIQVLSSKAGRYGDIRPPAGFVRAHDTCFEAGKKFGVLAGQKTVAKKLGDGPKVMMLDGRNKPVEIFKKADLIEAAGLTKGERAGHKPAKQQSPEAAAKREREDLAQKNSADETLRFIAKAIGGNKGLDEDLLRAVVENAVQSWQDIAECRGWKPPKGTAQHFRLETWKSYIAKLDAAELLGVLVEDLVRGDYDFEEVDQKNGLLPDLCKLFKVNRQGLYKAELVRLEAIETAKADEKPEPKKGGAKPARKAGKK